MVSLFHGLFQSLYLIWDTTSYPFHKQISPGAPTAQLETKQRVEGRAEFQNVFIHVEPRAMQAGIGRYQHLQTRSKKKHSWLIWGFPKIGVPQNGWFIMENPIKMDDLGVPLFLETPKWLMAYQPPPKPQKK